LAEDHWGVSYVVWEMALLKELGFGLDLSRCAGGGDAMDIAYMSPKSGCAVSLDKGEPYKAKLLPLPEFLKREYVDNNSPDQNINFSEISKINQLWACLVVMRVVRRGFFKMSEEELLIRR